MLFTRARRRLLLGGLTAALAAAAPAAEAARRRSHASAPHHPAQQKARSTPLPLIVVDPGHGGRDPGAIGVSGTPEKDVTLATALELKRQLLATGRYRVLLTRDHDTTLELAARVAFARDHDATMLISIHADAAPVHGARGASVYIGAPRSPVRQVRPRAGDIARALADEPAAPETASDWLRRVMLRNLGEEVDLTAAPSRAAHLYVLGSGIPSVLLEMGFLSNRRDEAALRNPAHRRAIAGAVREAVDEYFARMRHTPGRRT